MMEHPPHTPKVGRHVVQGWVGNGPGLPRRVLSYANTAAAVLLLALGTGAVAAPITFDPDGGSGGSGNLIATDFNWAPTSFVAVGGVTAINNFAANPSCPAGSCDFDVLSHATMTKILDNGADVTPAALGATYEITMTMRFGQAVTALTPSTASFAVNASAPVFVEWWYDTALNADPLTGHGFGDGRLILRASSIAAGPGGSVTVTGGGAGTPLDAFGADDYPGQDSVTATGGIGTLNFGGLVVDPAFFPAGIASLALAGIFPTALPYILVDPSDCYRIVGAGVAVAGMQGDTVCDAAHVLGAFSTQGTAFGPDGYVPVTGAVNGISGPDFDPQVVFTAKVSAVPEPASLPLLGAAFGAVAWFRRRRGSMA